MGQSPARWVTGISTVGVSEVVRAIDERTGEAVINNNPVGAAARAIENKSLGPLQDALRADRVVTAATRNVPVVNSIAGFQTSAVNTLQTLQPLNLGGAGLLTRGPQQTPEGQLAYAAALVAYEAYKNWSGRKSTLTDKRGRNWNELQGWRNDKMAIYTCGSSCIIGLRGTGDAVDVSQDLDLAFFEGLIHAAHEGGRTRLSCQKVHQLVQQFSTVCLTGHSLGGFLAHQLALAHTEVTAHLFNAGAMGFNPFHHGAYMFIKIPERATHHHVRGDPISAGFSEALATRREYNCSWDFPHAHFMGHFILPRDRA
jgi:hypothetical protein